MEPATWLEPRTTGGEGRATSSGNVSLVITFLVIIIIVIIIIIIIDYFAHLLSKFILWLRFSAVDTTNSALFKSYSVAAAAGTLRLCCAYLNQYSSSSSCNASQSKSISVLRWMVSFRSADRTTYGRRSEYASHDASVLCIVIRRKQRIDRGMCSLSHRLRKRSAIWFFAETAPASQPYVTIWRRPLGLSCYSTNRTVSDGSEVGTLESNWLIRTRNKKNRKPIVRESREELRQW